MKSVSVFAQEHQYVVYFEYDKSNIPDSSLIYIAQYLHSNIIDRVLIEGHCDSIGSREYNYGLSNRRANEVKKLLTDNGIANKSIKTCIGFGKEKPLVTNESEARRQLNRRAVLTFYLKEKEDTITEISKSLADSTSQIEPDEYNINDFEVGQSIVLKDLYFWGGRHVLKPSSYPELRKLYRLLLHYPSLKIEIHGHVCCTTLEPDGYDWDTDKDNLSVSRARTIMYYLIDQGISSKRLSYKGFGGTKKINLDESTEELRSVNRRVEFHILEK
jgi:outer membrane protein OmpA-like peptidoglycan-associated protein